jgi:alkylhydroperoxidase/carboxymuconolactone decarboxylase family protein YurZ
MTARNKIEEIIRKRKEAHARLARLDSRVYRAFLEMEKAAFSDGALSRKHKELIAAAIGVVTNCESCMQWHID